MAIIEEIRWRLESMCDEKNVEFVSRILPNIDSSRILAIKTPALRAMAKEMGRREDVGEFLDDLPHRYHEENQIHAFILSGIRDYGRCISEVERFLPFVDNWATCDQMSPKTFEKHKAELFERIKLWLGADHEYTVRFGMCRLMSLYLDDDFDPCHLEMVAQLRREEYYIKMMQAWYFATALAKQPVATMPYIEQRRLEPWTHNKAIQKAVESYRIDDATKTYLKTLKIKNK